MSMMPTFQCYTKGVLADSLTGATAAFERMLETGLCEEQALPPLVATCLWGNLADLSLSAGAKLIDPGAASAGVSVASTSTSVSSSRLTAVFLRVEDVVSEKGPTTEWRLSRILS